MFVTTDKRHNALTKNSTAHSNNTIQTHSTENTNLSSLRMLIKGRSSKNLRLAEALRPWFKNQKLKVSSNSLTKFSDQV